MRARGVDYSWGPSPTADGIRFRLWAPAEETLLLRISGADTPMPRHDDGWFEVRIAGQPFGQDYGFVLSDGSVVPDPASRQQADVLGLSTLVDPGAYRWRCEGWQGRPWKEAVFYELHIGAFTREGTFRAAAERLAYLADLGFTAIEVMPLAHFPGRRGWGYDGVFQYAPFSPYGSAGDFKALVDAAHELGLMVFLDVVYNHFGPSGNFLSRYAPAFFLEENPTPWGPRIDFSEEPVRRFFIENAIYWLTEFRLDGLRLDAVDQIEDGSEVHVLQQLSEEVRSAVADRQVHMLTENPVNGTDLMAEQKDGRRLYAADWNDDFHHAVHAAATGEHTGHYAPFAQHAWRKAAQALAQGYLTEGRRILPVEPPATSALPTSCFVHFLQNHDQVGNRAVGDRIHKTLDGDLHAALVAVLVLTPQIPLFFMGDDHLSTRPFTFFADYDGDLRADVWRNREREAIGFGGFPDGFGPEDIVDPSDPAAFENCKLDWNEVARPGMEEWRGFLRELLETRRRSVVPLIGESTRGGRVIDSPEGCLFVDWTHPRGVLRLRANLTEKPVPLESGLGEEIYPRTAAPQDASLAPYRVRLFNGPDRGT